MRKATIALVGLASLFLIQGAAQAAAAKEQPRKSIVQMMRENGFKHKSASWTSTSVTVDESNKTTTSEGKIWISGDKYRMESKDQQGKKVIMLDDGKELYMINLEEKKAYTGAAMESMFSSVMSSDMVSQSVKQRKTAKKLGKETVDGKACQIYQYPLTMTIMGNKSTSDVKEWVWTAEGFPVKTVVKTPKHKMKVSFMTVNVPASESTNTIKNLELDKAMDESLFQVPAGIQVERMDSMPGADAGETEEGSDSGSAKPAKSKASDSEAGDEGGEKPQVDVNKMLKGLF